MADQEHETERPDELELFPASTRQESNLELSGLITSAIPVLGTLADRALNQLAQHKRFERLGTVLKMVVDRLGKLEAASEEYLRSEDGEVLVFETLRRASDEWNEEKLALYGAFLAHAIKLPTDEDLEQRIRFLRTLDQLLPSQFHVLRAFVQDDTFPNENLARDSWEREYENRVSAQAMLEKRLPQLSPLRINDLIRQLDDELGLVEAEGLDQPFSDRAEAAKVLRVKGVSEYGHRWLRFIGEEGAGIRPH
jgi:hypothetical protein